jgi:GntR family transcriptional regulator, transcriptional repressor for pyruvate dehydrogenase complex
MTHAAIGFDRIETKTAYEKVAEAIERRILSGDLRVGEALGPEMELAKQFGVNRSTVREGIRLLEQSGLVMREASRRLVVTAPQYQRLTSRMTRSRILEQVTFRELYNASLVLEIGILEQAVDKRTNDDISALKANIAETVKNQKNPTAVAQGDSEFHRLVCDAAHNPVLAMAKEPSSMFVRQVTAFILSNHPKGIQRLIAAHVHILNALRRRDPIAARLWMERHLQDWWAGFELSGIHPDAPINGIDQSA